MSTGTKESRESTLNSLRMERNKMVSVSLVQIFLNFLPASPHLIPFVFVVLTKSQREVFDKVKAFVLQHRQGSSPSALRAARLALPNDFPARDRQFIDTLSADLHLSVQWDEYDENDTNLVTWRFPSSLSGADEKEVAEEADGNAKQPDDDDSEDDAEARAAVDRVLKKYEKAPVMDKDAEGTFDERHAQAVKEKMDEWKRGYYQVRIYPCVFFFLRLINPSTLSGKIGVLLR